jgi:site-specific recombinase XerC
VTIEISSWEIKLRKMQKTVRHLVYQLLCFIGKSRFYLIDFILPNLNEFMPEGIRINQITAGHAKEFHEKLKARGMATTTIHKRIQFARQFMHDAVDWKIIEENPFLKVKTQKSSVKVNEFVPREVVDKLMKKANPVWQGILGLSRFGELRTLSETLSLRREDIDWEMN